jgi:hypothetical protein
MADFCGLWGFDWIKEAKAQYPTVTNISNQQAWVYCHWQVGREFACRGCLQGMHCILCRWSDSDRPVMGDPLCGIGGITIGRLAEEARYISLMRNWRKLLVISCQCQSIGSKLYRMAGRNTLPKIFWTQESRRLAAFTSAPQGRNAASLQLAILILIRYKMGRSVQSR